MSLFILVGIAELMLENMFTSNIMFIYISTKSVSETTEQVLYF